ncbi:hypothetical protein POM88_032912 [Heracleum sosnowskyi]|nr:hypothetical protein POM88_032912 [Heracleum sosnowskyi]
MQYEYCVDEQNTLILKASHCTPVETTSLYAATGCDSEESRMILAATVPMVELQIESLDDIGSDFGSCKGLLYFSENEQGQLAKFVVSNPLKSQFTILPRPPVKMLDLWGTQWAATGLGFDSSTKTFKLICTNRKLKRPHSPVTLVHTLGTMSWREVPSFPAYYCMTPDQHKSVFVHGFLHWMIDPSEIKNCEGRILAFDVSKEIYKVIPHPEISFNERQRNYRILDIKGDLCMLDLSPGIKFDIWVMDYEKKSWSKDYTIDITIVGNMYVDILRDIFLWKQDEILFHVRKAGYSRQDDGYWSYSMRTGNLKECENQSSNLQVLSLKGSLISVPGAKSFSTSASKSLLAGGVAGGVSRTAAAPLQCLKILLQVQNPHNIKYNGAFQGLKYIWRTECFKGLFKGNGNNCARIVPNSAVKFFSYEQALKKLAMVFNVFGGCEKKRVGRSTIVNLAGEAKLVHPPSLELLSICKSLLAGGVAGGVSRAAVVPLECLKILLQVRNPHNIKYNGTGLKYMWITECFNGLFNGNGSNCVRIVPYPALKFFSYEQASKGILWLYRQQTGNGKSVEEDLMDMIDREADGSDSLEACNAVLISSSTTMISVERWLNVLSPLEDFASQGGGRKSLLCLEDDFDSSR